MEFFSPYIRFFFDVLINDLMLGNFCSQCMKNFTNSKFNSKQYFFGNCFFSCIIESLCVDLPAPKNGAKACETWVPGLACTVHCNKGYGLALKPDPVYICSPDTGKWLNFNSPSRKHMKPALPDCSSKQTMGVKPMTFYTPIWSYGNLIP